MPKAKTNVVKQQKVLEVNDLKVQFPIGEGKYFNALKGITFHVNQGEVVGLVGESGSGKSTTAKAILGLVEHSSGHVKITNELVPNKPKNIKGRINRWLASKVQMIFQDAKSSLNPREKVYDIIVEGARNQKLFEKTKLSSELTIGEEWMTHNKAEFGDTIFFEYKSTELAYKQALKDAQQRYDDANTEAFTKFDDQRIIVEGLKLSKLADIRSYKTAYKFTKAQKLPLAKITERIGQDKIDSYLKDIKKPSNKESVLVNQILKEKLSIDIEFIKQQFEKNIAKEKTVLEKLKTKYTKQKNKLHARLSKEKHAINKEWHKYKHKHFTDYKKQKTEEGTKSYAALGSWNDHFSKSAALLNKRQFYRKVVKDAMNAVSISPEFVNRFPGEFSGGQAQRIAIARTIAMENELIIADEPISALDVSIQAQVINLLKKLIKEKNLTILFIAHDLQVVRYISNRIVVMYKGEIVEQGDAQEVYHNPVHPYTQSLVNAVPSIDHPERLRNSKSYKSNDYEDFINFNEVKKDWAKVNANHFVYGQPKNTKKWIAKAKKNKK